MFFERFSAKFSLALIEAIYFILTKDEVKCKRKKLLLGVVGKSKSIAWINLNPWEERARCWMVDWLVWVAMNLIKDFFLSPKNIYIDWGWLTGWWIRRVTLSFDIIFVCHTNFFLFFCLCFRIIKIFILPSFSKAPDFLSSLHSPRKDWWCFCFTTHLSANLCLREMFCT